MNFWNRLAMSVVAVLALVAAILTLSVAVEAVEPDFLPGGFVDPQTNGWFERELEGLADLSSRDQTIAIVVTIAVALAMLAVLFLEVTTLNKKETLLPVSTNPEGVLSIEASSVRLLAERTAGNNRDVNSIRCKLAVRRRTAPGGPASISISCYPRVILGSNVREIRDDLQVRIKEAVQEMTGLIVLQVNVVNVRYDKGDISRLIGT